jgi:hypothetical protein
VVEDDLTQITEGISHGFEAPALVIDEKLDLDECTKLGIENHGTSLYVPDELILQGVPKSAGSGSSCGGDLDEVRHNGAVETRTQGAIHATPVWIDSDDGGDIIDDMIGELILAEGVEEKGLPPIVVQREVVEDNEDEGFDVEEETAYT